MTASVERVRWDRKKWIYAIFAVFAFQLGAILVLSKPEPSQTPAPAFRTAIHLPDDLWAVERANEGGLLDPTVFALPSWHGFSRDAWLGFVRPEFRLTDWTEPPQWLNVGSEELGDSLHRFILSNTMPALLIADKPLPRLRREDLSVGQAPVNTRSELEVAGDLAGWIRDDAAELPSFAHTEVLTNTVVQMLVNSRGYTISAVLLAGSGLAEVDEFALQTAKAARFGAPRIRNGPERSALRTASGKLIFKWHTVPVTNVPGPAAAVAP